MTRMGPNTERATLTGEPAEGWMSHDGRARTVTWTMDARGAVDLADLIDRSYPADDMAHEDAAALRHHALKAFAE